jgi:Response regulator containing CheY-like receiver, AAA-type ATPase, and DNA-binding domains
MSKNKGRALIIDDEEEIRESIELLLNSEGISTVTAKNGEEGLIKLEEDLFDLVLLDLMLPGKSGMDVQKDIKRMDPSLPVVIITAMAGIESAVAAIKEGCFDYVTKPWDNEKLIVIVNNAVKQRQLMSENSHLRRALKERFEFSNIVGKANRSSRFWTWFRRLRPSRSTV